MIIVENFNSVSFHRQPNTDKPDTNTGIELKDMIGNNQDCCHIVVTAGDKSYPILRKDPNVRKKPKNPEDPKSAGASASGYINRSEQFIVIVSGWWISRDGGISYERPEGGILIDCGLNRVSLF